MHYSAFYLGSVTWSGRNLAFSGYLAANLASATNGTLLASTCRHARNINSLGELEVEVEANPCRTMKGVKKGDNPIVAGMAGRYSRSLP